MKYKLINWDISGINYDKFIKQFNIEDTTNIEEIIIDKMDQLLTNENDNLVKQGLQITSFNSDYEQTILTEGNYSKWNKETLLLTYNVYDCTENGMLINTIDLERKKINNDKFEWLINELQTMGVHCPGNHKHNYLFYSCPICKKNNEKCWIYLNSFHTETYSNTDCNDKNHKEFFKRLQQDLKLKWRDQQDPDFTRVDWDDNWVIVSFKNDEDEKETLSLKEYKDRYDFEDGPKIIKYEILSVIENTKALLKHYKVEIKYNIIKRKFEVFKNDIKHYESLETYLTKLRDCGIKHNYRPFKEKIESDIVNIGWNNQYNPVEDWLKQCHAKYLTNIEMGEKAFKDICNTVETTEHLKEWFLKHSFLQMVYMGCRTEYGETRPIENQFLPVFQGGQGEGKTRWYRSLLPDMFKYDYFMSLLVLDVANKDHLIEVSSNWLVEIGEISSTFKKSDQDSLKAYITNTKDRVRIPYAKEHIDIKRRTCFCGTTNDYEYLRDLTGSRRFLTMGNVNLNAEHTVDIEFLWGYFYDMYLKGERYWHNKDEIQLVERSNEKYLSKPETIMSIEDTLDLKPLSNEGSWYKCSELFNHLIGNIYITNPIQLGKVLRKYNVKSRINTKSNSHEYFVKLLNDKSIEDNNL